jgi:hypothetical protein
MYQKAMRDFPKHCRLCCDVNGEQFEAIKWFGSVLLVWGFAFPMISFPYP